MVEKVSSYDNATARSGGVVNEVQNTYNVFGQLSKRYQEHGTSVNTWTSPKMQFAKVGG